MLKDQINKTIVETTKNIFTLPGYIHERTWTSEVVYQLSKIVPENFFIHTEEPADTSRGRIDIVIRDDNYETFCGIELKGVYEAGFPLELLCNLETDEELFKSFLNKTKAIITDKSEYGKRSSYSRTPDGNYIIFPAVFEDIIELHNQYKRLISLGVLGVVVYVDHNDDYSIRTKTHGISEKTFKNNFKFRKKIIEEIIEYDPNQKVEYLHFVKFNSTSGPYIELL